MFPSSSDPLNWGRWSVIFTLGLAVTALMRPADAATRFDVSFDQEAQRLPLSGRVFIFISRTNEPEVRLQARLSSPQIFGVDVRSVEAGEIIAIDDGVVGHPYDRIKDLPKGEYYVQAFGMNYVEYPRADGHTVWALDQWRQQDFTRSPGGLYSTPEKVLIDPGRDQIFKLRLTQRTPEVAEAQDTRWVKHIKLRSELLSRFWGKPIYLGASVLLPRGYGEDRTKLYPVIYEPRNHYLRTEAFDVSEVPATESQESRRARLANGYETGEEFLSAWSSDGFPRMIIARIIATTPYYDYSGARNSVNNGPYQDAIMKELIPYLETHFRIIRQPWARGLVGKSSGGHDALQLQVDRPEFFGGAWILYPSTFDFRWFAGMNVYEDDNAFYADSRPDFVQSDASPPWARFERSFPLSLQGKPTYTVRGVAHSEFAVGGQTSVNEEMQGCYNPTLSPVGSDGYPMPLYDQQTGAINHSVAEYWRSHGDLAEYIRGHWSQVGPHLVGKLHFAIGDADEWYRQYALYDLENFFRQAMPAARATFRYGPRKGHGWQYETNAALVREVADYMGAQMPAGADNAWRTAH